MWAYTKFPGMVGICLLCVSSQVQLILIQCHISALRASVSPGFSRLQFSVVRPTLHKHLSSV